METLTGAELEVGVSTLTLAGEHECGDLHLVAPFDGGVLIAVVDGAGHGREAADAARMTRDILNKYAHESVLFLMSHCHEKLRPTRGAVMSLASFNMVQGTMTWAGVGNVEGRLLCNNGEVDSRALVSSVGTLGHRMAPLYPAVVQVKRGDTLILATDGVRESFYEDLNLNQSPQKISDHILARDARRTDDALVMVARYRGRVA